MAKNIKRIKLPGVTDVYDVVDATAIHSEDVATSTKAGIVKIGSGITVAADGTISVNATAPVTSVNGKTGKVVLTAADVGALPTSGGTLTGNLQVGSASIQTNGYVVGTWLQGTAQNHLGYAATKIAVQDASGWVYHRTAEEVKSDIGLGNVDNVRQYSASNPPPYPVTSVNGQTGAVTLESGGTNIVVSRTQPSGQKAGDFWFQIVD